jgi:hypothetical protein
LNDSVILFKENEGKFHILDDNATGMKYPNPRGWGGGHEMGKRNLQLPSIQSI